MHCISCGFAHPEFGNYCRKCGEVLFKPSQDIQQIASAVLPDQRISSPTVEGFAYADLGNRLAAYFCDVTIAFFLGIVAFGVSGYLKHPIPTDEGTSTAVFVVVLILYMIATHAVSGMSIGKYVCGIRVVDFKNVNKKPHFGQVLIRELLGRPISSVLWCAGYWVSINHPFKQAWSDRMAGTVVRHFNPKSGLKNTLLVVVILLLVVDISAFVYGTNLEEKAHRRAAILEKVKQQSDAVRQSREKVNEIYQADDANFYALQNKMNNLLPELKTYDGHIDSLVATFDEVEREDLYASGSDRQQSRALREALIIRKEQSAKLREEADLIIGYNVSRGNWRDFQLQLKLLDSDITALDSHAKEIMSSADLD